MNIGNNIKKSNSNKILRKTNCLYLIYIIKYLLNNNKIKYCYEYIFCLNRKYILDKPNIKCQKDNIIHRIYKCKFWRKNEKQYKQIKKKKSKSKYIYF